MPESSERGTSSGVTSLQQIADVPGRTLPYLWARSHMVEARAWLANQLTAAAIFPTPQLLRRRSRCGEASLLRAVNSGRCTRKRATAILKVARDQLGVHQASGAAIVPTANPAPSSLSSLLLLRARPALRHHARERTLRLLQRPLLFLGSAHHPITPVGICVTAASVDRRYRIQSVRQVRFLQASQ